MLVKNIYDEVCDRLHLYTCGVRIDGEKRKLTAKDFDFKKYTLTEAEMVIIVESAVNGSKEVKKCETSEEKVLKWLAATLTFNIALLVMFKLCEDFSTGFFSVKLLSDSETGYSESVDILRVHKRLDDPTGPLTMSSLIQDVLSSNNAIHSTTFKQIMPVGYSEMLINGNITEGSGEHCINVIKTALRVFIAEKHIKAIDALVHLEEVLRTIKDSDTFEVEKPDAIGIGRLVVKPTLLESQNFIGNMSVPELVYMLYTASGLNNYVDTYPNVSKRLVLNIVVHDYSMVALLAELQDPICRKLTETVFNYVRVTSTSDIRMLKKAYVSFSTSRPVLDENSYNVNFGTCGLKPSNIEVVDEYTLKITKQYMQYVNFPLLGIIHLS